MKHTAVIQKNRQILNKLFSGKEELNEIREKFLEEAGLASCQPSRTTIATGHQPLIFYPGLFFKNVFTHQLAEESETSPVNFLVDTDVAGFQVQVPYRHENEYRKKQISVKNPDELTYYSFEPSEQQVQDFLDETANAVHTLSHEEIEGALRKFRSAFFHFYNETRQFGETVNFLRNDFQYKQGMNFSNFPVSDIAGSEAYSRYVLYIIEHIESFQRAYNQAVEIHKSGDYQPVKFLAFENGWYELPFWLIEYGQRHQVFIKEEADTITFSSASANKEITFDRYAGREEMLSQMRVELTLYPKATTLTLMIRLFLCDVFVHGTGAVEYEKVNNEFLRLFFSMDEPPAFFTATGEIYLPLADFPDDYTRLQAEYRKKQHWLNEVKRDPEQFLDEKLADQYKAQKKELAQHLQKEKDSKQRREINRQLESINEKMLKELEPRIHHVNSEMNYYRKVLDKKHVFYERTYPYFLYPEGYLTRRRFENYMRSELVEGNKG